MRLNRAVIQKGLERQLVYYWFEGRGRQMTGDFAAKFATIADSLTLGRTDGGLVRVITPIGADGVAAADARLRRFLAASVDAPAPLHPGMTPRFACPTPHSTRHSTLGPTPARFGAPAPDAPPLVSILVISYNTRAMTLDCLASVVAETTVPYELIVLDNASPDGSAAAIAEAFPGHPADREPARTSASPRATTSPPARPAASTSCSSTPTPWCSTGRSTASSPSPSARPEARIWGGRTLNGDGSLNPTSVFGRLTLWSLFCRASGLALIFRRSAFFNPEEIGDWDRGERARGRRGAGQLLPDPPRPLGGARRLRSRPSSCTARRRTSACAPRARGARPRMTPEATIVHFHGASSRRADREIMTLKATATVIRRHFPAWQRPLGLFLLGVWPWSRMVSGDALARLSGRPRFAEAARLWGAVWRARADWRRGYPPVGPS